MKEFFETKSLAVIGVSDQPTNLAKRIIDNLLLNKYKGKIIPVGRASGNVFGFPIIQSVKDFKGKIDGAVILTPASTIPDLMEECGQKGIRWITIESGGFAEFGDVGLDLSNRIKKIAARYGIRIIGPNCIGVINTKIGLTTPFPAVPKIKSGPLSVMSQSGGVGLTYLKEFGDEYVGFSKFTSIGNKLDVDEVDILKVYMEDPDTEVIAAYLEGFSRGREFFKIAKAGKKPIIVHKSNVTPLTQTIAASHTAAMLSDDAVVDQALRQAGVIRVESIRDMLNTVKIFLLPPMRGNRLAVISRSGGHAVIASDACYKYGFELPEFPEQIIQQVYRHSRSDVIKLTNPMDLGTMYHLQTYKEILRDLLRHPGFDGMCFLLPNFSRFKSDILEELINWIVHLNKTYNKPLVFCLHSWDMELRQEKELFAGFPIYESMEEAIAALAASRDFGMYMERRVKKIAKPKVSGGAAAKQIKAFIKQKRSSVGAEGFSLLENYSIPTPMCRLAFSPEEAARIATEMGFPVVLKVESPDALHKTDVGGVILNIKNKAAVKSAFRHIKKVLLQSKPDADFSGCLVQSMAPDGLDLIIGGKWDKDFGPVIMLNWGGIFAEAFKKPVIRLAPVIKDDALAMINSIQGHEILHGYRNLPKRDLNALADTLVAASYLISDIPKIKEMDLNPVRIFAEGDGVMALDVRLILKN